MESSVVANNSRDDEARPNTPGKGDYLHSLYAHLPVGITIKDWSAVKQRLDKLRDEGVRDIPLYLRENPDICYELLHLINILSVNDAMLSLYKVNSFDEYLTSEYEAFRDFQNSREKTSRIESYFGVLDNLLKGRNHRDEYTDTVNDGTAIHVAYTTWVPEGHEDDWGVVISINEDVTRRKVAEDRIRASEAKLQSLFNNAPEGIFFKNADGLYEMVNHTFAHRLGFSDADDMIGKSDFDILPEEDAVRFREDDTRCMESGEVSIKELDIPLPDGREILQLGVKFPVVSANGETMGIGGIEIDITERKRLERMKSEFVSTISHELRTPLTAIKGSLGLVVGGSISGMPEEITNMLGIAYQNTEHLVTLVNDILDMEKIESGSMELNLQRVDLGELVLQSIEANQGYADEFDENIIAGDMDSHMFANGDPVRIKQIIDNLLSNAIKFSDKGSDVTVTATRLNATTAKVSVADNGIGIPEEFQHHIFDRFTQTDSSDTRKISGTGLGLNIVKSLVEQHGGSIDYTSKMGAGTTFFFTLPLVE